MASLDNSSSKNPIIRRAEQQYAEQYNGPGFASVDPKTGQQQRRLGTPPTTPPPPPGTADAATLHQMYQAPAVAGASGIAMTLNDVIMKSVLNFAILLVGAVAGWATAISMPWLWIVAAIIGLVLGLTNAFKKQVSPILIMAYALVQGVFLGGISNFYQRYGEAQGWGNLVLTAVIATFVVFAVMLALYTTRVIKVTGRFKKIMFVSIVSYAVFALVNFVFAIFTGAGGGWGVFGMGPIGIILSLFVVGLAAFTLMLDFDAIEQGIRYGVPERESWRMAFGLMVTIIWLYLEILRLLAIVAGRN